jgi:hypothetical protein
MDSESHLSMPQYDRISFWLASVHESYLPLTPPPDNDSKLPLKRKRAMSLPLSARSDSPKRRRTDDADDVRPEQSASQLGSENPLVLNERNTFSPLASRVSSSPKRSSSPTRETPIILRGAWPPVFTESLNGLKEAPPKHAERLGDRLVEGIDFGFIPQGLQVRVFDSVFPSQIHMYIACHQERLRGGPPTHQTGRLRPQRLALHRGAVDHMEGSQEDLSQCARLQGWEPG